MARIPFRVTDMRVWGVLSPSTGDTQAPSIPANVVATAINAGRVDLTWTASTDDFGVTGYQIFRNGTPLSTSTLTSYSDTTCQPSTAYSYVIVAYDAAGNNSAASSAGLATTPANAAPVWQSIPAQVPIVGNSYLLQFTDYCTDADLDTLTFSVPPETLPSGIVLSGNRLQGTPTTAGQTPTITVRAADAFHTIDTTIAFSTKTADVTAPPVPTGVSASAVGSSQIDVSWTASTDAAGSADELVSGTQDYRVYRSIDGTNYSLRTTVTGTSYSDTGLSASTPYWYKVASRDVALNESAQSAAQSATTSAASSLPLLFTDDFESGGFGHTENGMAYGSRTGVAVTTENPHAGTRSCKFTFVGSQPGLGDPSDAWAELRLGFGASVYREVKIEFWVYIPNGLEGYGGAAYTIRAENPNNNKFVRLWRGNKSDGNDGYSSFYNKHGCSLNRNGSTIANMISEYGHDGGIGQNGADGNGPGAQGYTSYVTAADRGTWIKAAFYAKAATQSSPANGINRIYRNDVLVGESTNLPSLPNGGVSLAGFDFCYILGYANSGFLNTTYLFVDELKVYAAP